MPADCTLWAADGDSLHAVAAIFRDLSKAGAYLEAKVWKNRRTHTNNNNNLPSSGRSQALPALQFHVR